MRLHPLGVLVAVGGVDHHPELVRALAPDYDIVHRSAALVRHERVARLTVAHTADIVGEQSVESLFGALAGEQEFTHMRHIEYARLLPHGAVLEGYAGVLHGQHVARELHHLPAERDMPVVKSGLPCHVSSFPPPVRSRHFLFVASPKISSHASATLS